VGGRRSLLSSGNPSGSGPGDYPEDDGSNYLGGGANYNGYSNVAAGYNSASNYAAYEGKPVSLVGGVFGAQLYHGGAGGVADAGLYTDPYVLSSLAVRVMSPYHAVRITDSYGSGGHPYCFHPQSLLFFHQPIQDHLESAYGVLQQLEFRTTATAINSKNNGTVGGHSGQIKSQ
jgi:hypothetical protein